MSKERSFCILFCVAIVLVVFKVLGVVSCSWLWVLAPLWISIAIVVSIALALTLVLEFEYFCAAFDCIKEYFANGRKKAKSREATK